MRKHAKKLVTLLFALALMAGCLFMTTEAKASVAGPEKVDVKKGIIWHTRMRVDLNNRSNAWADICLANPEHYVATVKSSSKNLIAKVVNDYKLTSGNIRHDEATDTYYKRRVSIGFHAKKKGNYTVTVTIKDSKKKTVAKKKIKVFAGYPGNAVETLSYGSSTYYMVGGGSNILTSTPSSKLKITANDTYKIKTIELATKYTKDGTPIYKKISNGAQITLATKTTYEKVWYDSETYRTGCKYKFLKPMTMVRVTYRDKKLRVTRSEEYYIFNVK